MKFAKNDICCADVKAKKNIINKRPDGCILQILERSILLEIQCKKGMYFSFDFSWCYPC